MSKNRFGNGNELEAWLDSFGGRLYLKAIGLMNHYLGGDCEAAKNPAFVIRSLVDAADNSYTPWPDTPPVYADLYEVSVPVPAFQYYHAKRQDSERRLEAALREHIDGQGGVVGRLRVSIVPARLWSRRLSITSTFLPEAQFGGAAASNPDVTRDADGASAKASAAIQNDDTVKAGAYATGETFQMPGRAGRDKKNVGVFASYGDTVVKPTSHGAAESMPQQGLSRGAYVSCPGLAHLKLANNSTFGTLREGSQRPTIILPEPQFLGTGFMAGAFSRRGETWRVTAYAETGLDVRRRNERVHVNRGQAVELEDGDSILLTNEADGRVLDTPLSFNLVA